MNEFSKLAEDKAPIFFYLRIYRENGKLRLEALKEAISNPPRPYDFTMEFYTSSTNRVLVCLYFDGLEPDFKVNERIQSKILEYFSGGWFFKLS
jgi:hypothetical protein